MKISVPAVVAAVLFGVVITSAPVFAQGIKVDVPFAFTVTGKTTAPAGSYELSEQSPELIRMVSMTSTKTEFMLPVITRLGAADEPQSKLVFDKVGNTSVLSEVWIDGGDGYLVYVTKGAHTHQAVKGAKK